MFQTLSYGGRFKFKLMLEAVNTVTSPPPDDVIANSLIYLVGNFRVKLFYPMPAQRSRGHSRGSRSRLDFEVVMREVWTLFCREIGQVEHIALLLLLLLLPLPPLRRGHARVVNNDFLFLAARLVVYWPAPIHAVEPLAYSVLTWLPARLAVCYSQIRSILSSATTFTTATLRWQQSRYRTVLLMEKN